MNKGFERLVTLFVVGVVVTATAPSFATASGGTRAGIADAGSVSEAATVQASDTARGGALQAQESGAQEITECTTIDSPGRYVLSEDINRSAPPEEQGTCIEIASSNVVFDGSGGEIKGRIDFDAYGAWRVIGGTAILAENVTNVTIRDVQLRTWKTGVRFRNVSDGDIQIQGYDHAGPDVVDSERIVFHDSVLRTTGSSFEADDVVVRRNDIDMDSEESADIQTVRDGIRIVGNDSEVSNNTVETVELIDEPSPTAVVVEGEQNRVRGNLIVGEYPTRREPNPYEGFGFSVLGDDNTISENTVAWTGYPSEIRGRNNTFVNNKVNNTDLDVSGRDNQVAFVVDGDSVRLSITGTGSTVAGSQIDQIALGDDASAVRNTVTSVRSRGADVTLAGNTVGNEIHLDGVTNGTLRNNSVGTLIHLEGASNNTLRNDTAGRVVLADSRNNSLRGLAAENITLRSLSDHNAVTGSSAVRIQVEDDSRNNTLRDNHASIRIAGATSFDNRIVDNNATGADVGIELNRSSRTLLLNNTVRRNGRGIVLVGASDNRLVNNTAIDNDGPAYVSQDGSTNNTVTNLTVGPTVSFRSRDVTLDRESSPPEPPSGRTDVGVFLDATNTSTESWLNLTAYYSASAAENVEEETLRLWRYNGSWAEVPGFNSVDTAENVVSGNVSGDAFGVLAPLGSATDATPPTISGYEVRTTGDDDATLVVEFDSSERLPEIRTVLTDASGDEVARLNESGFTESGTGPYTYTGAVALPNGTYTATLEAATDDAGNDGAGGQSATVTIGGVPVQLSLTANLTTVDPGDTVGFTVTRTDTGDRVNATVVADGRSVVTGSDGRANVSFPDSGTFDVTANKARTATETFRNDTVEITVRTPSTDQARIAVDPTSKTVSTNESFRVAVTYDVTAPDEVYGVQFTLEYDTSRLRATNVTKGPYLGAEGDTLVLNRSVDDETGRIGYGESRRMEGGVSGAGIVAYVEFTAVARLNAEAARANISITEVKAGDPNGRRIETARRNGSVRVVRDRPPELSATLTSLVNNVGSPVGVGVRATDDVEIRAVRLFAPGGTETDVLLCGTPECNGTVSNTPSTSSWNGSTGNYDPVTYRVVATDDRGASTTETVRTEVRIAGDANGDGVVDIFDAVEVGRSWTCTVDDPCYSAAGDLNNDGVVDVLDAVLLGRNWQKTAGG